MGIRSRALRKCFGEAFLARSEDDIFLGLREHNKRDETFSIDEHTFSPPKET